MGVFDDILASRVNDEAERKTLAELSAKYGLNAVVEDWDGKLKGWEDWSKANVIQDPNNPGKILTKGEMALRSQVGELETKVRDYETTLLTGGDVNFDDVIRELDKRGVVNKTQVEAVVNPVKAQADELKTRMEQQYVNMDRFYWSTMNLPVKHNREFGEDLDAMKFREFYIKGTEADPNKAYDLFVAEKRTAKQTELAKQKEAEQAAAMKAKYEEGVKAGKLAASQSQQSVGMPADQGTAADGMGYLQMQQNARVANQQLPEDVDPVPGKTLGQGIARDGLKWIYDQRTKQSSAVN